MLALQGDWEAHLAVINDLGLDSRPVRTIAELSAVDGLVLPGGESSTMLRLMVSEGLGEAIRGRVIRGMPVLATCAGVILLAAAVEPEQPSLGLLDVDVERNAYGRQRHSTVGDIELAAALGAPSSTEGVFIRAPRILRVGEGVEVLGWWRGDPVLVRQGPIIGATYHPELTVDRRVHDLFVRTEARDEQAVAAAR